MYTSYDVIEYLLSTTGGGAQDQEHRVLRQALFHGYRDLISVRDWKWYHTVDRIEVSPTSRITTYTLPWGVQSVDAVQFDNSFSPVSYVNQTDWERVVNNQYVESQLSVWTILPSKFSPDRYELKLLNGSNRTPEVTLTYRRRPRDLRCTGWEPTSRAGTVNWEGSEVVGDGTSFSNQMLGSVLRVSGDPRFQPESLAGMHPYRDEGLIYQVVNGGKLYAWSPVEGIRYSGTKYVITDYLDISPNMYTALLSGTEAWAARLLGKNIEGSTAVYGRDLRLAFEQDAMAPLSGRRDQSGHYYPFWYLRPGVDQGVVGPGFGGPDEEGGTCPIKPPISGGDADDEQLGNWDGGRADTTYSPCG